MGMQIIPSRSVIHPVEQILASPVSAGETLWRQLDPERRKQLAQRLSEMIQRMRNQPCNQEKIQDERH